MPYEYDEMIKANTDKMRAKMESGAKHMNALEKILGDMDTYLKATEQCWTGVAAEEYRSIFGKLLYATAEDVVELRTYLDELGVYIELQEQADAEAQAVANDALQISQDTEVTNG